MDDKSALHRLLDMYSGSNEAPTAQELEYLSQSTSGLRQNLESVEEEINRHEARLQSLHATRNGIIEKLRRPRVILSLVRRLPEDVLTEIFLRCLPDDRYPTLHLADAPLLLTTICKRWRSTALHSPQLWAKAHITVGAYDDGEPQSGTSAETLQRYRVEAAERLGLIQRFVTRSGVLPLSLSIRTLWLHQEGEKISPALEWIATVLPRVKCLHWSGLPPTDGYLLRLPVECFASLEELKAEWSIEDAFPPKPPIFLSPNLKNIEMKPSDSSSRSPSSWGMLQRFEHITRLLLSNIDYESAFDIPSLATALKLCPMLEEVHSTVRGDRPSAGVMVPSKEKRSVPLLHLQSLSLYYYHKIERLLQLLYVPVLTELALQDDRNHDNLPLIRPSTTLAGFVEFHEYCLHNVVKLDIVLIDYQYQGFVECIKQLPNLRHLVIAKPTSDSSYGYQQREEDRSHGFKEDLLVRLTPRMVHAEATSSNSSEAQSASDDPPSRRTAMRLECLCPFLERFDFLERRNYVNNGHLTLRTVIPFVSAKWEMSKDHPHLVSKLKHLTLPTRTLPNKSVKKALKEWRVHAGLVLEIAYPYLKASQKSEQYEGMWGEGSDSGY